MTYPIKTPKKLIEVALPLDDINAACAHEKQPGIGAHPRGLHLWWARRPLAAARAVIFAQMVNDPGYERNLQRGINKKDAQLERERLFGIIRKLVQWENTNNEEVLSEARVEIWKSWRETCGLNKNHPQAAKLFNPETLPAFHDPFAGGGALPLEAQRLGLESYASDLNPVAVLINKAMIEIPPKFAGRAPVGPQIATDKGSKKDATRDAFTDWSGAKGLAEDVRRYGAWMRDEAFKRVGHLYPQVDLPKEYGGGMATVIAWLWARTVKSPNPAFSHVDVPLVSTFILSSKAGKDAYVEPIIDREKYHFEVRTGKPPESAKAGTTAGKRSAFICLLSGSPIDYNHIRAEGKAGRIGQKLMAVVAEGARGRVYLSPRADMEEIATQAKPEWRPETQMPDNPRDFKTPNYGMRGFGDLFTPRQLVTLTTFSDLVQEAREKIKADALQSGIQDDGVGLDDGGMRVTAYADAVAVYLAFAIDRLADYGSSIATWKSSGEQVMQTFKRQALPMTWDFPESNFFAGKSICWENAIKYTADNLLKSSGGLNCIPGFAFQHDAQTQKVSASKVVSTDPPYYDNIGYADLSDFFYVWLRRALRSIYPSLFSTMAVPKSEELVATPYRHGSKEKAEIFFLDGMTEAMHRLAEQTHGAFPTTIYYAFKQSDTTDVGTGNTGWETFLEAVLRAGFVLTGTWPMRTELANRMIGSGTNALASSIVLVCRKRDTNAATISRREFLRELKEELREAVDVMIGGAEGVSPVAPVDLAQAVIGPGMAIFSKYTAVLEADGTPMTVHTALQLINRMLVEGEDEFDADTQFCLGWFDECGWSTGEFGKADVLARAKGTSVQGVQDAGVVLAGAGKVRLLKPLEYPTEWEPESDNSTPVWESLHHLSRALTQGGEAAAGALLARMPERAEPVRSLAYRMYTLCERKKWAEEARAYNELITAWIGIESASHENGHVGGQGKLDI
jgi:putative DNA methylase